MHSHFYFIDPDAFDIKVKDCNCEIQKDHMNAALYEDENIDHYEWVDDKWIPVKTVENR